MNKEDYFISCFNSKRIGDDAAIVDGWVISKDAFFENVHFKREWFSLQEIAYKSMIINISDAIAMNAVAKYALLAVALPSNLSRSEIKDLYLGFDKAAKEFGIEIIGGDTVSNIKIDITVTILAKSKSPLKRVGLKSGHYLAYTGSLGSSKKSLDSLLRGGKGRKKSRFFKPVLRQEFIKDTRRFLSCGMDISDGLFSDLNKLHKANTLGFRFMSKISRSVGCSGEEYEMLIGFSPKHKKTMIRRAQARRCSVNIFAKAQRKNYKSLCKAHHF
ncbi:thiamine-phosphate kinase [Sulfurimonas sp. MAG313]|nr:thiamine-phosphate kinase [Sulfurimonas sp. MAG313]MDF1880074.1 thiamine-phosphate kinase [Sulfurimonas sp. MAG313]